MAELSADIYELEARQRIRGRDLYDWDKCPNCGAVPGKSKTSRSAGVAHRWVSCGDSDQRLLRSRLEELQIRRDLRAFARRS